MNTAPSKSIINTNKINTQYPSQLFLTFSPMSLLRISALFILISTLTIGTV